MGIGGDGCWAGLWLILELGKGKWMESESDKKIKFRLI
jgi:hypothetical protein